MIKRILHKGENRLGIELDYNSKLVEIIKKAPGRRWSQTKKLWHIPDSEASMKFLKEFLPEMYKSFSTNVIDGKVNNVFKKSDTGENTPISNIILAKDDVKNVKTVEVTKDVLFYESGKRIILVLKWGAKDIDFVKTLKFHIYNSINKWWVITNTNENLNAIHSYFGKRIKTIKSEDLLPTVKAFNTIGINELHIIEHIKGRIKIIFKYSKELVSLIKTFPYYTWDKENGWWTTVNTKYVIESIENYCTENKITVKYFNKTNSVIKGRQLKEQIPNYRTCPQNFTDKLLLLRYSDNTIKTYSSSFEEFINFYNTKNINEISEPEIIEFTRYLVVERGVSASYQNQAINAIKFYYEKVLGESRKFYNLDRPKKEKTLPEVLAKEDINKMINATNNLKHKCLIILIYSAGLRVSEAVNMKLIDIDSKRGIIVIRQGKGKKDRNSLLSNKTLLILREYYKLYQPKEYLFSGMNGGKYTSSSILKVVKNAAEKGGIEKKVTTHTLRHSFATHLLEQGVNLRYIQSILGHESSKTTEIYTHISSMGIKDIKNPLDDMEF